MHLNTKSFKTVNSALSDWLEILGPVLWACVEHRIDVKPGRESLPEIRLSSMEWKDFKVCALTKLVYMLL